ncbi:MAG: hypothetical protein MZV70_41580 [Desulfobacterales bacterium]|nr:hypothetical protein [Desulfobacterales bacterium]
MLDGFARRAGHDAEPRRSFRGTGGSLYLPALPGHPDRFRARAHRGPRQGSRASCIGVVRTSARCWTTRSTTSRDGSCSASRCHRWRATTCWW